MPAVGLPEHRPLALLPLEPVPPVLCFVAAATPIAFVVAFEVAVPGVLLPPLHAVQLCALLPARGDDPVTHEEPGDDKVSFVDGPEPETDASGAKVSGGGPQSMPSCFASSCITCV